MQTRRRHDPPEDQAPSPDRRPARGVAGTLGRAAAHRQRSGGRLHGRAPAGVRQRRGRERARANAASDPKGDAKEPLPGWGDPELGDDESVAAFDLTGGFWPDGTPGPTPQLMVVWNEDGGFSGTGKVKGAGELKLFVDSDFRIDEATDVNVTHAFRAFWKVKPKNQWGDLEIGKGSVKRGQVKGVGNSAREVQLTGLETEELADSVILKATFTGPSATETFIVNQDRSYAAPTMTVKFKVRLQMEGAHLGPKPPAYNLHPQSFFFPEGKSDFTDRHAVQLADFLKNAPRRPPDVDQHRCPRRGTGPDQRLRQSQGETRREPRLGRCAGGSGAQAARAVRDPPREHPPRVHSRRAR